MTRILLIGNYPPDRQHSMLRYAAWLAGTLNKCGLQTDLLQPSICFGRLAESEHPAQKWFGYIDKFMLFPFILMAKARRYDIVHICDHSNAPYRLFARSTPVSVTCHDLIGIRSMLGEYGRPRPRWSGRLLQRWILSSLRKIRFVCCVSDNTAVELQRLAPLAERRCHTIPNPVIGFAPMAEDEAEHEIRAAGLDPNKPFLLSVGSNIWYKNRLGIVQLFAEMLGHNTFAGMSLVYAGAALTPQIKSIVGVLGIASKISEIESPSNKLLRALYSKAAALIFISLTEGFGWPIIEAQACGCPVITSNLPPMKDIAGGAGFVVNPSAPVEAADMIREYWQWILSQRQTSLDNAALFSEARASDLYESFYQDMAKSLAPRDRRFRP